MGKQAVIALATMKGGSGKSTVAACLATYWLQQGKRTAVLDADPQLSVMRWRETGEGLDGLHCTAVKNTNVKTEIARHLDEGYDRIVVDTPGFRLPVTESVLDASNLCLIPLRPSPVDFEVAADLVELIARMKDRGASGPATYRFLLTQVVGGSVISRHMRAELKNAGYPLMNVDIRHRVAYAETALMGSTPTLKYPNSAAAMETAELGAEIDRNLE